MTDLEKKTTSIGDKEYKPLVVEWKTHHPHVKKPGEANFRQIDEHVVAIIKPANIMHTHDAYLVGLSPQTALNLLAWLEQERELLEQLATQDET